MVRLVIHAQFVCQGSPILWAISTEFVLGTVQQSQILVIGDPQRSLQRRIEHTSLCNSIGIRMGDAPVATEILVSAHS